MYGDRGIFCFTINFILCYETFMRPATDAQPYDESLSGAFGIPEFMPPVGGGLSR